MVDPLHHARAFWKLLVGEDELDGLAGYRIPGERRARRINVWGTDSIPNKYRVTHGTGEFSLYAAVQRIEVPPDSAEVLAEIRDLSGNQHSFILWFAEEQCAVIPFDPNAAIEALRLEQYVPDARRTVLPPPVLSAYYSVKPLIPAWMRGQLRGAIAARAKESEPFLSWPSDRSLDDLMRLLLRLMLMTMGRETQPFVWFWPDQHPWAAILTHDVETAAGLAHVPDVMEIEARHGLRSSFNLVPDDYEVRGSILLELQNAGFEVGVHGYTHDGLMFAKWSTFLKRVVAINEIGRQWGAAGFRSPATYRNLEWCHLLGFEYDSSVTDTAPFEPQPGGCASLFPYMVGELVELPMTLPQDHTLFSLLKHLDANTWLTKLTEIRDTYGMACVLTHPDPGDGYIGRKDNEAHYTEVLDYIGGSDAWTPLPRELARWWRTRAMVEAGARAPGGFSAGTAVLNPSGGVELLPPTG
jgi:hypothetical protein